MKRAHQTLVAFALVAMGCRDKKSGSPPPPPVVAPEPVKSATPPYDAGAVKSLLALPARVAVSSLVDNPSADPNHLIDGSTKTAWNGKTGDLRAWIAVRLPIGDRVTALKIAVGFDGKDASGGDLFRMNHRVRKIAISRDGQPLRQVDLDPSDAYPDAGDALTLSEWSGEYEDMQDGPRKTFRVQPDGGVTLSR